MNSTEFLPSTISIYDTEHDGPAVWAIDIGLGALFSLCLLQALLGNAVILFLLARYRPYISANAFTVLAVTLSISDILMVLLSGIPNVIALLQMRKGMDQRFCDVSGFALNFNNRLNSFITTCICLVRCLVVVMPIKARILLNKRALSTMVCGCVLMAAFYSSLPFLFSQLTNGSITQYGYRKWIGFCMFFVYFQDNYSLKLVSTLLIEAVFFAPFLVAIFTASILLYTLKRRNKYIGLEAKNETKRSAVVVIIRVTILTLICVTPQLAFSVYTKCNWAYNLNWFSLRSEMYLNYMFGQQLIIYLRASINPFIIDMPAYLKRGKEMRKNVIAQKEHRKLSTTTNLTCHSKIIYRARPSTGGPGMLYGHSGTNTPLDTPRTARSAVGSAGAVAGSPRLNDYYDESVQGMITIQTRGPSPTVRTPDSLDARVQKSDRSSVTRMTLSAEDVPDNVYVDTSPRRKHINNGSAKNKENVPDDGVMECDGAKNGEQREQTGETREKKIRRSATDCCLRRGKVLNRTKSANWSQKFLIGHNDKDV